MADNVTHLNKNVSDVEPEEKTLPLTNVGIALTMMERALEKGSSPGFYLFYGHSGWGKTVAATACVLDFNAVYLCATPGMSARSLLVELLDQMGEKPRGKSNHDYIKQASKALLLTGRALIVDEADFLLKRGVIETLRAVLDRSQARIILIGEEEIERQLQGRERVHNRIQGFYPAQPCSTADARAMAQHYAAGVEIAPDLLEEMVKQTGKITRRVRTNLVEMRREALSGGVEAIDLSWWQANGKAFSTGSRPARPMSRGSGGAI